MEGQDDTSFRRSRTLQGSTSSTIKTVNPKRASLQSERLKQQQKVKRRRLLTFIAGIIVLAIGFIWFLIGQYIVGIGDISFTPATTSQPEMAKYTTVITRYLDEHPVERFRFALNQTRLNQYVSATMPEVSNVTATGFLSNRPDFAITLRKPIAVWKGETTQSFVDDKGVSFSQNFYTAPSVSIVDSSGIKETQTGVTVVSERLLRFLGRLIAITNTSGLGKVTEATLPKNTTREIDIKIQNRPYYIKTHIDRDPAATVEDIKRVVNYLDQKKITLQYIDVRVSGRAFYK